MVRDNVGAVRERSRNMNPLIYYGRMEDYSGGDSLINKNSSKYKTEPIKWKYLDTMD